MDFKKKLHDLFATVSYCKQNPDVIKDYASLNTEMVTCSGEKLSLLMQLKASDVEDKRIIADLNSQIVSLNSSVSDWQKKYDDLKSSLVLNWEDEVSKETLDVINGYYNKYNEADVTYDGRPLPGSSGNCEMSVQNWAQYGYDSPELREFVKSKGCFVEDVMFKDNLGFHLACDKTVMKIKGSLSPFYRYGTDSSTTGVSEYWKFALETYLTGTKGGASDCEDWSFLNYNLCRIAGIPKELMRMGCGYTRTNEGHCTNYYLASDLKFHHINSTTCYSESTDVKSLPLTGDENDKIGLSNVWFSFCESKSWSEFFVGSGQEESFNKLKPSKLLKHIKIRWKKK